MAQSTRPQLASQPKMAALVRVEEMTDLEIVSAWALTFPACGLLAYLLTRLMLG